jgi:hypothetical protein
MDLQRMATEVRGKGKKTHFRIKQEEMIKK